MRKSLSAIVALVIFSFVISGLGSDASGLGVTYTYDLVGRVTSAIYDNGMCIAYTYDDVGNRTSQTNAAAGAPAWGSGFWGCFVWTP